MLNWLLIGTAMASLSMTVPTQEDPGGSQVVHGPDEMIAAEDLMDHPELWEGVRVDPNGGLIWPGEKAGQTTNAAVALK